MTRSIRIAVLAVAALLTAAAFVPAAGNAGTRSRECSFTASGLPCPCPRSEKVRTVARAIGTAVRVTAHALQRTAASPAKR
jgi:hypothetical protein